MRFHAFDRPSRREVLAMLAIVGFSLCLKLAAIATFHHMPESDELAYQSMALNLIHGLGIVDVAGNRAMYNVGYPLFVLAPVFALFDDGLLAARVVNAFLGIVAIVMTWWVAKEAGAGRIGRLAAAASWGAYLPASVYVVYLNKESLLTPLMLGVLVGGLRLLRDPSWHVAAILGILFGLIALTGNAGLSLAAPVFLALLLARLDWKHKIAFAALALVVGAMVAAPWMIRNARVLGAPVLNTNGGFNLYLGNNPAATGAFVSIGDTPRGDSWADLRKLGEVRASEILKQDAFAWIRDNPASFARLAIRKAGQFWSPPTHEGKKKSSMVETSLRWVWAAEFVCFAMLALATVVFRETRNRYTAMLWVGIAGYTSVYMLFYVSTRYREPIIPLVCILAAIALERVLRLRQGRYPGWLP